MANSKIVEKIKKILALANDKGATPEEAATAAAMAQRMMMQHQIEEADLVEKGQKQLDPIAYEIFYDSARVDTWIQQLANSIAPAFCCVVLLSPGRGLGIVGRPENREAYKVTFDYLKEAVHKMAVATCPKTIHGRRWANSYGMGCSVKIHQRVKEERAALKAAADAMNDYAIIILREDDLAREFVKNQMQTKAGNKSQADFDPNGYTKGYVDGDKVNLGSVPGRNQFSGKALTA